MFEDMQFTMCASPDAALGETLEWWKAIDALGFDYIGLPDTPMLMREVYVSLTAAALNTSNAKLMLMVTNPRTRDVSVTAGAMLALRDLVGDRIHFGIGAGDSASFAIGLGVATADEMADYLVALRELTAGNNVRHNDRDLKAAWQAWEPFRPHLLMAGAGEKSLRAAGRVADSVISAYGMLPETIERATELVHEGAREAGRDPEAIDIWHMVLVTPGETTEEGFLYASSLGSLLSKGGSAGKIIPPELEPGLLEMAAEYSLETHSRDNDAILEIGRRTGTIDYLAARSGGMLGPVDRTEAVAKLRSYGAKNLIFTALGPDRLGTVKSLAENVIAQRG